MINRVPWIITLLVLTEKVTAGYNNYYSHNYKHNSVIFTKITTLSNIIQIAVSLISDRKRLIEQQESVHVCSNHNDTVTVFRFTS